MKLPKSTITNMQPLVIEGQHRLGVSHKKPKVTDEALAIIELHFGTMHPEVKKSQLLFGTNDE